MIRDELLFYVQAGKRKVPYMYINLKTYDSNNPNIRIWGDFSENSGGGGYLKYFDCLHFYTIDADRYPTERLLKTITSENPKVIMLQDDVGRKLEKPLKNQYILERNHMINNDSIGTGENCIYKSKRVSRDDIPNIVNLLLTAKEFSIVYQRDTLLNQMLDRYDAGISRYYAIKDNGVLVASCCSYGETEDMAIVGGLIVHNAYRKRGLASDTVSHLCRDLRCEGKSCISFVNHDNIPSLALYKKLGGKIYSTYYKFIRKD